MGGIAIDLIPVYPITPVVFWGEAILQDRYGNITRGLSRPWCSFAVYFAEAVGATIYALPYSQFCLQKGTGAQFRFVDLTGQYDDVGLRNQFAPEKLLKIAVSERFPRLIRVVRKTRDLFSR